MKMPYFSKYAFAVTASLIGVVNFGPQAWADEVKDYPNKPVKIVVPFPAGGSTDLLARMLGEKLTTKFGRPFIIENRPGAAANIGATYVAKSVAPDGYTILLGTSAALAVNPSLYKNLSYSPSKDFRPIILATLLPGVVVVNENTPANSFKELTTYLSNKGNEVSFASNGYGTPPHLGGELYKKLANLPKLVHVPYQGGAHALTGLVGNQTTMMVGAAPEILPLVKAGKLRPLAVAAPQRLALLPDVPTTAEEGLPQFEVVLWYALVAPTGTPSGIVAKLNAAFDEALKDPQIKKRLTDQGFEVAGGPPSVLEAKMKSEAVFWDKLIKEANITIE